MRKALPMMPKLRQAEPVVATLMDGRQVALPSDEWRDECAARYIAGLQDRAHRKALLEHLAKEWGEESGRRIEATVRQLFEKGRRR